MDQNITLLGKTATKAAKVIGLGGAYVPALNRTFIPKETFDNDGNDTTGIAAQNVVAHELEHARQFNMPGGLHKPLRQGDGKLFRVWIACPIPCSGHSVRSACVDGRRKRRCR